MAAPPGCPCLLLHMQHVSIPFQIRGSIVVSISARHAEDPGSIPGRGVANDHLEP